jgi:hypothetical protein
MLKKLVLNQKFKLVSFACKVSRSSLEFFQFKEVDLGHFLAYFLLDLKLVKCLVLHLRSS